MQQKRKVPNDWLKERGIYLERKGRTGTSTTQMSKETISLIKQQLPKNVTLEMFIIRLMNKEQ